MPEAQFTLPADNTHARWSRTIPPVLTVPSGAVVEVFTQEATGGQLSLESTLSDVAALDFDRIHALTGPVYVEGAQPGDVLAVTLHEIEVGDWGWAAIVPGFGFLADVFTEPYLKLFELGPGATHAVFNDRIRVLLAPFAGVMGVAPDTDSLLVTIPPRANGGNMDNRHMTAGTTVYFPVFVEGALFSLAVPTCSFSLPSPYPNSLRAPCLTYVGREGIDEAARKASLFMIDYLVAEHGMDRADAYVLASLAGDLKISETVDMPHYLVSMHMPKEVLGVGR